MKGSSRRVLLFFTITIWGTIFVFFNLSLLTILLIFLFFVIVMLFVSGTISIHEIREDLRKWRFERREKKRINKSRLEEEKRAKASYAAQTDNGNKKKRLSLPKFSLKRKGRETTSVSGTGPSVPKISGKGTFSLMKEGISAFFRDMKKTREKPEKAKTVRSPAQPTDISQNRQPENIDRESTPVTSGLSRESGPDLEIPSMTDKGEEIDEELLANLDLDDDMGMLDDINPEIDKKDSKSGIDDTDEDNKMEQLDIASDTGRVTPQIDEEDSNIEVTDILMTYADELEDGKSGEPGLSSISDEDLDNVDLDAEQSSFESTERTQGMMGIAGEGEGGGGFDDDSPVAQEQDQFSFGGGGGGDDDLMAALKADISIEKKDDKNMLLRDLKDVKVNADEIENELKEVLGTFSGPRKKRRKR